MSIKKKALLAIIVCSLFALSLAGSMLVLDKLEVRERQHCYGMAQSQLGCLTRQMGNAFNAARILAERCVLPDGGVTAFPQIARSLMIPDIIRAMQLAPDGRILYAYPPLSLRKPPRDLFSEPKEKADARRSRVTGQPFIVGPIELQQGGQGIIYRLPIYRGKDSRTFWGFSTTVIDLGRLLAHLHAAFGNLSDLRFALYRQDTNGTRIRLAGLDREELAEPLEISSIMPNGPWFLAVEPSGGWKPLWLETGLYSLSLLLSALLSLLVCRSFGCLPQLASPIIMENRDPLTHCPNKNALLQDLADWIASRDKFCLISLSLTNFNALNGRYGYDTGERLLLGMAQRLRSLMPRSARLYRTDTCAFALLLDRETTGPLMKTLNLQFANPLHLGAQEITCRPALGIAQFPLDGHIPVRLLGKAEERRERDTWEQRAD